MHYILISVQALAMVIGMTFDFIFTFLWKFKMPKSKLEEIAERNAFSNYSVQDQEDLTPQNVVTSVLLLGIAVLLIGYIMYLCGAFEKLAK